MESKELENWMPIIEYSVKTGVSLSTIRRKIKSNSIPYRLEAGKYLVQYGAPVSPHPTTYINNLTPVLQRTPSHANASRETPQDDSLKMMTEAFEYALKEKDERIRLLEKRNRDLENNLEELRLLIHVLEDKYQVRY